MSPRADPGERLRRLLAIIPWLAARGTASIEEIAERFGMDVTTVEDELLLAACCGLPPYSPDQLIELVVDDDGVTANIPPYFRRPLKLTAADGFAILAAGQALLAVPGSDDAGPLASALAKLAGVLGGASGVTVELDAPATLDDLRAAVDGSERVEVEYYSLSSDSVTTRLLSPVALFAERGHWYLEAWDERAGAVLHFRADRVRTLRRTGERFDRAAVLDAAGSPEVGEGVFRPSPDMPEATLLLPAAARWVVETYPTTAVDELDDGWLRVRLAVSNRPWLERLLLRVGPEGRVEAPAELVDTGREAAARLLARYAAVERP
jgi:proteasome accessory factor C